MNKFDKIYDRVMATLTTELPGHFVYHNVDHTKYVLDKAMLIAEHEGVNEEELFLIKVAALYHDIGFIQSKDKHEEIGCTIAHQELQKESFNSNAVDSICGMIMATKIPQKPLTPLEKIIADADLEYLGTDSFVPTSERLYEELRHFNNELSSKEWYKLQIDFISAHQYHTQFCKTNREPIKHKNLKNLILLFSEL